MKYKEIIDKLKPDMTRKDVIEVLGEPDDKGGTSRKYKAPSIYKYGNLEICFQPWASGKLVHAWDEENETIVKEF